MERLENSQKIHSSFSEDSIDLGFVHVTFTCLHCFARVLNIWNI